MSGIVSHYRNALIAITCGVVAAVPVFAQEKSAAPAAPVSSEDSIAAAKREFELLKAARDGSLQQKGELPKLSVPELHRGAPGPSLFPPTTSKAAVAPKKSSNWLVDAMVKPSELSKSRDPLRRDRLRDRERDESEGLISPDTDNTEEFSSSRRDSEPAPESRRSGVQRVENPLAQYLGEWMTPQDYALLKPGLELSLATGGDSRTVPGGNELAPGLPGSGGTGETSFDFLTKSSAAPASPARENPFLQGLNLPSLTPASVPLPAGSSVWEPTAPAQTAATLPPQLPPPARSRVPDFAKPATDDKYFKQLKRF